MNAKQFLSLLDPRLPPETVQIIAFSYERSAISEEDCWNLMSPDEQQRANQFVFPKHKLHFTIAHGMLRFILAHFTGHDATGLLFTRAIVGKPCFADPELAEWQFNLSHSDTGVAIALSRHMPVGIDLECINPERPFIDLAQRFFSPQETAAIMKLPLGEQALAFYRLWTCKEAVLKATGEGIADGLANWVFDIHTRDPRLIAAPDRVDCRAWQFYHQTLPFIESVLTAAIAATSIQFRYLAID